MIKYVKGDVVKAFKNGEIDVLLHQTNCLGVMGSGIAKQIRAEFPDVFEEYSTLCKDYIYPNIFERESKDLLGEVQLVKIESGKLIANAFTQNNYGYEGNKYCSYDAIDSVIRWVSAYSVSDKIGMPKIGAGLGGGDWKVIEAIINSHFPDRDIYVYTLE